MVAMGTNSAASKCQRDIFHSAAFRRMARLGRSQRSGTSKNSIQAHSSTNQRGMAAQIRQADDNSGRCLLSSGDCEFVNKVIHDPSMNYQPKYDKRLGQLAKLAASLNNRKRNPAKNKLHQDSSNDEHDGLGSALAAAGSASYWDSTRKEQEREERKRQVQERKERERQEWERQEREHRAQERMVQERRVQEPMVQERRVYEHMVYERIVRERRAQERQDQERNDQERKVYECKKQKLQGTEAQGTRTQGGQDNITQDEIGCCPICTVVAVGAFVLVRRLTSWRRS